MPTSGQTVGGEDRVVGPGWHAKVYAMVRRVPAGRVSTYGQIATLLGSPRVARHVGFALAALLDGADKREGGPVPWHRIINSRGAISFKGDTVRAVRQREKLESEGIEFTATGKVSLKRFLWEPGEDRLDDLLSGEPVDPG